MMNTMNTKIEFMLNGEVSEPAMYSKELIEMLGMLLIATNFLEWRCARLPYLQQCL